MNTSTLLPILSALFISTTALAQQGVAHNSGTDAVNRQVNRALVVPLPDYYYMSTSGTIISKRGNDSAQLQAPVKLADGSTLTPGGSVVRPDGTRNQLIDGQMISPTGKIGNAPATTGQESAAVDKTPERKANQ